jgi:dienelactone hydrolase
MDSHPENGRKRRALYPSVKRFVSGNRWVLVIGACLVGIPFATYLTGERYRTIDYRDRFIEMRGRLSAAEETIVESAGGHRLLAVTLENDRGIAVKGYLKVPDDSAAARHPALLLLGGVRTGRNTIDYIDNTRGVVLFAFDYPYEGKKERFDPGEFLLAIPRIRRAVVETVPAAMLCVDYLLNRDDVDAERIVVVGGSVGAVFAPAVVATDERIAAAGLLFGAADIQHLMRTNLNTPDWVARPVSWLGAVLVSPVEPVKYIGAISPRPVFMLNGTGDPRMPTRCSQLLHETAREPKRIRWIDAGHVNIRSREFHELVSRELADWLVANKLVTPDCLVEP